MTGSADYFLNRHWTVKDVSMSNGTPSPQPVEDVAAPDVFRFTRQGNGSRIVCHTPGRNPDVDRRWEGTAFVHDPEHDRLLGMLVHEARRQVYVLEITRWVDPNYPGDWIQCGYVAYRHIPHSEEATIVHEGWWHGDGNP